MWLHMTLLRHKLVGQYLTSLACFTQIFYKYFNLLLGLKYIYYLVSYICKYRQNLQKLS